MNRPLACRARTASPSRIRCRSMMSGPSPDICRRGGQPTPGRAEFNASPSSARLVATVGVAAAAIEGETVMLTESADTVRVLDIGIRIGHTDNDRAEAAVIVAAGREHRGDQRIALIVP